MELNRARSRLFVQSFGAALLAAAGHPPQAAAQGGLPYTIEPPEGSVSFGRVVASGGDADGDGLPDIFIGDPGIQRGQEWIGRWAMYRGVDGARIWSVSGSLAIRQIFEPVVRAAFIDDFDGDGCDDVLLGLHEALDWSGVVQVLSGRTGELLREFVGNPRQGIGISVARLGDLDRNGVDEFGYSDYAGSDGLTYVRHGATGDLRMIIDPPGAWSTRRLADAGDLNDDDMPDLVLATYEGGFGRPVSSMLMTVSGRDGTVLWQLAPGLNENFTSPCSSGADLTGDGVPDVAVRTTVAETILIVSGASGEVAWSFDAPLRGVTWGLNLAFADVNADARPELAATYRTNLGVAVDVVNPRDGGPVHWALGIQRGWPGQAALADVNGDGSDDFIIGSAGGGVVVHGGSPLLLHFSERRSDYNITPGQSYDFAVVGARPGRSVHLLGSLRGNGCTFVPRLGICIDLDQRIHNLGSAVAEPDHTARFTIEAPPNLPRGPLWMQAIDPSDPGRGAITSNVMRLEVVD